MLEELGSVVGQLLGWSHGPEADIPPGPSAAVNENASHAELETNSTDGNPSQTGEISTPTLESNLEVAALQVPAAASESRSEEDTPQDMKAQPLDSLPRQSSLPLPVPLHSRDESLTVQNSIGSSSAHVRTPSRVPISPRPSRHHRRTSSTTEVSASLSSALADQLSASWANSFSDAPLQFAGLGPPVMDLARPGPISRLSSAASTTSGVPALNSSTSFMGEDTSYCGVSSAIHDAARITDWETVKQLCEEDPEAAKFVGRDRWTALHHACNRRCPREDVVEALIRAYPEALLLEVEKGWYPLHFACRFKAPREVVRLLVHMYPEMGLTTVKKLDRQGRTPLYYAVRYDAPAGVVGILLAVNPSVVLEEDQNGDSPIGLVWDQWAEKLDGKRSLQRILGPAGSEETPEEHAIRVAKRLHSQSKILEKWNKANDFLKAAFGFPLNEEDSAMTSSEDRDITVDKFLAESKSPDGRIWRILHATAAVKCHLSLFQLACALYPGQASEYDECDLKGPLNIPGGWNTAKHLSVLHLASSSLASGETGRTIIQALHSMDPTLVKTKDGQGRLPLHLLAENKVKSHWTQDGIAEIYEAYPEAVRVQDNDGQLPLHRAATVIVPQGSTTDETMAARSVLSNLLTLHPEASAVADAFGRIPLHHAVQTSSSWDAQVQSLLDQFPHGVRSRTGVKLGNLLPLHMASKNPSTDLLMIKKLVEAHPRAASQSGREGKLPLHYACETGLSWECVKVLHEADPASIRQPEQNTRGWNALQMAAACTQSDKELLENLLNIFPEAASVSDSKGRYAFHLACIAGKTWKSGLEDLFEAYPSAVYMADSFGLLPFYLACFRYCTPGRKVEEKYSYTLSGVPVGGEAHVRGDSNATEILVRDQSAETEEAMQVDILFHLLKANPTVL